MRVIQEAHCDLFLEDKKSCDGKDAGTKDNRFFVIQTTVVVIFCGIIAIIDVVFESWVDRGNKVRNLHV